MTPRLDWEGDLPLRYDFASDNVAGAMPEAIEALVAANTSFAAGYGADHSRQARRRPDPGAAGTPTPRCASCPRAPAANAPDHRRPGRARTRR
ncbi:MAG: hypothetical protein WDM85_03450 [Caulobacteraceae bacterium]